MSFTATLNCGHKEWDLGLSFSLQSWLIAEYIWETSAENGFIFLASALSNEDFIGKPIKYISSSAEAVATT